MRVSSKVSMSGRSMSLSSVELADPSAEWVPYPASASAAERSMTLASALDL